MTPGSRSRRIARRTAGGAVAALALALGGGCNALPVGRVAPASNRPQTTLGKVGRAALLPATVALDVPSELAAIDPSNSAAGTVTPASAFGATPKADLISTELPAPPATPAAAATAAPLPPTPLLDAALVKARNRGEVADPAVAPAAATTGAVEPTSIPDLPQPPPALPPAEPAAEAASPSPIAPDPRPAADAAAPPVAPEELWRDGVRKLVGLARSRQEQGGNGAGPAGAEPWGLRARVLAWLAEPDIDPDLGQRDSDTVRSVLRALQATAGGENRADAHTRGDDVRQAVQTLESKAPLELVDLRLCSKVERFGDYTPFEAPGRRAGEWVVIYCEVDGLYQEPTSGGFQTRLAGRMEVVPEGGGPAIALPLDTAHDRSPRRRRDYYIAYLKELPRGLVPGAYTLRITIQDVAADRTATRAVPLTIVPNREAPAPPGEPAAGP